MRTASCWDPGAQFSTTLDTLVELRKGGTPVAQPFVILPFSNTEFIDTSFLRSIPHTVSGKCRNLFVHCWQYNLSMLSTAHKKAERMFFVLKVLLFAVLTLMISTFMIVFAKYFCDGASERARAAILGYVLSVDLGFVIFGLDGLWTQDRSLWGFFGVSPEVVIVLLVGFAWYRFLRQTSTASTQLT